MTELSVIALCAGWEPPEEPSCSDCRHALVSGPPAAPTVRCARGHGREILLWRLIRPKYHRGFVAAAKCPDFDSMSVEAS